MSLTITCASHAAEKYKLPGCEDLANTVRGPKASTPLDAIEATSKASFAKQIEILESSIQLIPQMTETSNLVRRMGDRILTILFSHPDAGQKVRLLATIEKIEVELRKKDTTNGNSQMVENFRFLSGYRPSGGQPPNRENPDSFPAFKSLDSWFLHQALYKRMAFDALFDTNSDFSKKDSTAALESLKQLYRYQVQARMSACQSFDKNGENLDAKAKKLAAEQRTQNRNLYLGELAKSGLSTQHRSQLQSTIDGEVFSPSEVAEVRAQAQIIINQHNNFAKTVRASKAVYSAELMEQAIKDNFQKGGYLATDYLRASDALKTNPLNYQVEAGEGWRMEQINSVKRENFERFRRENIGALEDEFYSNMCVEAYNKDFKWLNGLPHEAGKANEYQPIKCPRSFAWDSKLKEFMAYGDLLDPSILKNAQDSARKRLAAQQEIQRREAIPILQSHMAQLAYLKYKTRGQPGEYTDKPNMAALEKEINETSAHWGLSASEREILSLGADVKGGESHVQDQRKAYEKLTADLEVRQGVLKKKWEDQLKMKPVPRDQIVAGQSVLTAKTSPLDWAKYLRSQCQEEALLHASMMAARARLETLQGDPVTRTLKTGHHAPTVEEASGVVNRLRTNADSEYDKKYKDCLSQASKKVDWPTPSEADLRAKLGNYFSTYHKHVTSGPEKNRESCSELIGRWESHADKMEDFPPIVIGIGGFGERYSKRLRFLRDFKQDLESKGYHVDPKSMDFIWGADKEPPEKRPPESFAIQPYERTESRYPFYGEIMSTARKAGSIIDSTVDTLAAPADLVTKITGGKVHKSDWESALQIMAKDFWAKNVDRGEGVLPSNILWNAEKEGSDTLGFEYDEGEEALQCARELSKIVVKNPRTGKTEKPKIILTGFSTGADLVMKIGDQMGREGHPVAGVFATDPVDPLSHRDEFVASLKNKAAAYLIQKVQSIPGVGPTINQVFFGLNSNQVNAGVSAATNRPMIAAAPYQRPTGAGQVQVWHQNSDRNSVDGINKSMSGYSSGYHGGYLTNPAPGDTDHLITSQELLKWQPGWGAASGHYGATFISRDAFIAMVNKIKAQE